MAGTATVNFTNVVQAVDPLGAGFVCSEFSGVPLATSSSFKATCAALAPGHVRCSVAWLGGSPGYGAGGSGNKPGTAVGLINAITSIGALPLVSVNGGSSDNGFSSSDGGNLVSYLNASGRLAGGPVKYWSIGNEPDNTGGVGNYESLAPPTANSMLSAAAALNQQIVIGAPAAAYWDTGLLQWAAGQSWCGSLSYHAYDANDSPGSDNGGGGYSNTSEYYKQTGILRSYANPYGAGRLYGVEEFGWNSSAGTSSGPNNTYQGTIWYGDAMGQLLSSGAHGTVYADQNAGLGIIDDGSQGHSQGTPRPPYFGIGIWTGMNGQFKRYSSNFVSASSSYPATDLSIYACDNGKIVVFNKDATANSLVISMTLANGVTSGTYVVSSTGGIGTPFAAIVTSAVQSFSGSQISITIPGGTAVSIDVSGVTGGGSIAGGGSVTGSLSSGVNGDFATAGAGPYLFQLNEWNASSAHTCSYEYMPSTVPPSSGFTVTSSSVAVSTSGAPGAYSSLISGNHVVSGPAYKSPVSSQLPIRNSAISAGQVMCSVAGTMANSGAWDFAYDNWFSTSPSPSTVGNNANGLEMMIWLNHYGGVQPAGSAGATVTLDGISWTVWIAPGGPVSYVASTGMTSATLDMYPFIQDAISRGLMTASWYFIDIEAGFEIWNGGTGLAVNSFSTTNGAPTTGSGTSSYSSSDSGSGADSSNPVSSSGVSYVYSSESATGQDVTRNTPVVNSPALLVNDFTEGTSGVPLSTSNTSGAGENAFDEVSISSGNTVAFSSATAAHNNSSAAVQTSSGGGTAYFGWSTSLGTQGLTYGRAYFSLSAYPAAVDAVIAHYSSGAQVLGLQITAAGGGAASAGTWQVQDASFSYIHEFTSVIPLNTWTRLEWYVNCTTGTVTVNYYASADASSPTESYTATGQNFGASITEVDFGWTHAHASQPLMYIDDVALSITSFPGPYAPVVPVGTGGQGSTNTAGLDSAIGSDGPQSVNVVIPAGDTSEFSAAAVEAAVNATAALLNRGFLNIYSGPQPPVNGALTGTLLAQLSFGPQAFMPASASGGLVSAVANAITPASNPTTGTAGYFALVQSDGVTVVTTGSIGLSGADLNLSTLSIQSGVPVLCSQFQLAQKQS